MVRYSVDHPRLIAAVMVVVTLVLAALVPRVKVDTDPENMLSRDDPVRVFHNRVKERFSVHDMIVVGVVHESHPDGVFNPESLRKVYALTEYSKRLRGEGLRPGAIDVEAVLADAGLADGAEQETGPPEEAAGADAAPPPPEMGGAEAPAQEGPALPEMGPEAEAAEPALPAMGAEEEGEEPPPPPTGEEEKEAEAPTEPPAEEPAEPTDQKGVVVIDLLAPSTVDRIEHRAGTVHFSYLMQKPLPESEQEALAVRKGALDNPLLNGTVVSSDGRAVAIYLPITHKDVSYQVSRRLEEMISRLGGPEQYHVTGLPVAEDTFGHEMFVQMGISAPLAMLVIFILMLLFFRKLVLVISPMIIALVAVVWTMGLLIGLGYTVHIMSSMIPIFIMPIAVLDAVHILSEFFDRYQETRDRRKTCLRVMDSLFVPMLYTSLTSAAGFASLALTPIPPVQVFGVFVAFGIMAAWLLTVTFCPAYIMFIPESRLEGFGVSSAAEAPASPLTRLLHGLGRFTGRRTKLILTATLLAVVVALYGITRIRINDNPTRWFVADHPIRLADRVLNRHFAGTYQAYLSLAPEDQELSVSARASEVRDAIREARAKYAEKYEDKPLRGTFEAALELADRKEAAAEDAEAFLSALLGEVEERRRAAEGDAAYGWEEVAAAVEARQLLLEQPFKRPDLLRYVGRLEKALAEGDAATGAESVVGKSNSVTDIVKKVHKELRGDEEYYTVPDDPKMVAETLFQFGNSHTPDDLWHFVTPDYRRANVWFQLNSGDNKDMEAVVAQVEEFMRENPPPIPVEKNWFGLTYINVVWQQKMVVGMLQAFLGSFLVVFLLMTVLFHSALWGLLCMIPLTVTIALIYGVVGLVGKDYDMPVAVLSSLTLGLAVDFAIHFLARSRAAIKDADSWREASEHIFGEPARAISRNAIVVAVGFLPLLAAPLIPYKTVGIFMAAILAIAAVATLVLLPVLVGLFEERLFARLSVTRVTCNCAACVVASVAAVVLLALNFHQYFRMGWGTLTWISVVLIPILVFVCGFFSRRRACKQAAEEADQQEEGDEHESS